MNTPDFKEEVRELLVFAGSKGDELLEKMLINYLQRAWLDGGKEAIDASSSIISHITDRTKP